MSTERRTPDRSARPRLSYEKVETLHCGPHSTTSRVRDRQAETTYLLWAPIQDPGHDEGDPLDEELEILQTLGRECRFIRPETVGLQGFHGVLSSDLGGRPLTELIPPGGMEPARALWIATGLARLIQTLHGRRFVHKGVAGPSVMVNEETLQVDLLCHCLASRVPRETGEIVHPGRMEQALAFVSPEQTGRMNRAVDFRTDYYSLGVVMYQMLTGSVPFGGDDPAALVHAHIAVAPTPPAETIAAVPRALSDLVLKLMAKDAEERYQSSAGIIDDLKICARRLKEDGRIGSLDLGRSDVPERLRVPQKLFGRQQELERLDLAFNRVNQGHAEVVLVSGYSGIGKTALVQEMQKPILEHRGMLISGKSDQLQRNIPYKTLAQAFRELVRQLLTGSGEGVQRWRERLTDALGENAQVMIELVPELELIIGPQVPVEVLSPAEAELRFTTLLTRFINVFAGGDRPLVVFLDDLQWIDPASLKLIRHLATAAGETRLLLVGAYRDNEVTPTHPLMVMVDELKSADVTVVEIVLTPLGGESIRQIVAATLRCGDSEALQLARILERKTGGNPFFLIQFFETLAEEDLLRYDPLVRSWIWDEASITSLESTENVIALMVNKLQRLPADTREVLRIASCVGNTFDTATLSLVTGQPGEQVSAAVWEAVQQGIVVPRSRARGPGRRTRRPTMVTVGHCRFVHDRVQQAAASLCSAEELKAIHLKIGRLLREKAGKLDEHLFDVVSHMSLCIDLLHSESERRDLARLCLLAGQRAMASTAFLAAHDYLETGVELSGEDGWSTDYALTMSLHFGLAECTYITGKNDAAEAQFAQILQRARTDLEKARLYKIRTNLAVYDTKYPEALQHVLDGLALLGAPVPGADEQEALLALAQEEGAALGPLLEGKQILDLVELPEMTDEVHLVEAELLEELSILGMFLSPLLVQVATLRQVRLSLEHGNSNASPSAYAAHGMTIGSALGQFEDGYAFGKMAVELAQRRQAPRAETVARFWFGAFTSHWRRPIGESIEILKGGIELSQRIGAPLWSAFSSFFVPVHLDFAGGLIPDVAAEFGRYMLEQNPESLAGNAPYVQLLQALRGETESLTGFAEEAWGDDLISVMKDGNLLLALHHYFLARMMANVIFDRPAEALVTAELAAAEGDIRTVLFAQLATARFAFFHALALIDVLGQGCDAAGEAAHREKLDTHRTALQTWAENCPENFAPLHRLVEAGHAALEGDQPGAMDHFDAAIAAASRQGLLQHLALAHERAFRFHLAHGRGETGTLHLRAARTAYARWGATSKVSALDQEHPRLLPHAAAVHPARSGAAASVKSDSVDMVSVIKAARIVSDEAEYDKLLDRSMSVVTENAGAQRGLLLLVDQAGTLRVEGAADLAGSGPPPADHASSVVDYCRRTGELVLLAEATRDDLFCTDTYIRDNRPRSVLAMPLVHQGQFMGVLYLENNVLAGAFTPDQVQVLEALCAQIAVSIDNERMYQSFLMRMSHELRTPLNAIIGYSEMLKEDLTDEGMEDLTPDLDKIRGAGRHLLSLITDILDLSKMESGKTELFVEQFGLAALVEQVVTSVQPLVEKNSNTLTVDCPGDLGDITSDQARLQRVLFNLLSNSAKFTSDGQVTLRVRRRADGDGAGQVQFQVIDTGIGMTPEQLRVVFKSFRQVDASSTRKVDGSGLGLTIARRFCRLMGGEIQAESEIGVGTTMEVLVPACLG